MNEKGPIKIESRSSENDGNEKDFKDLSLSGLVSCAKETENVIEVSFMGSIKYTF